MTMTGTGRTKIYNEWKTVISLIVLFTIFIFIPPLHSANAEAPVIKAVEYVGLTRIDEEELRGIMSIGIGEVFNSRAIGEGVKRAYRKGIFTDIRVETEAAADGLKLRVVLKEIPLIRKIRISGNRYFSSRRIKEIISYEEDKDFREDRLDLSRKKLLNFFRRKGFRDAKAEIDVKTIEPSIVDLIVRVTEGDPLVINKIETDETARKKMKLSEGDIFDRDIFAKDIKRLAEYYKSKYYFSPVIGPYEFSDGTLVLPVNKGPKLELRFEGNKVYGNDELEEEVSFIDDETVTEEVVEEMVERIRKLYSSKGYFYVQITSAIEEEEEVLRVSFIIVEGRKVILKKIDIEGVKVSREAVMGMIALRANEPYDENLVQGSIESLTRFYNALGYLKMKVKQVEKEFDKKGTRLNVRFVIEEGPLTMITEIRLSGNEKLDGDEIRKAIDIDNGTAYNLIDIGDARYRVLSLYRRNGYTDVTVDVESGISEEDAVLDFRINENVHSVIGKVIVRGNYKTKLKIIKREFGVREGDPCNYEKLLNIKQRLYKLGIFNEVSIDLYDTGMYLNGSSVKDVIVTLREGKPGSVEVGIGYGEYEEFRTSLDISYNNIGGYNREAGMKAEFSSVEQRYVLNFREPWLFNQSDLAFNAFVMHEESRKVNIDTQDVLYKIDRLSFLADIEKEITRRLKANISYEYVFVDTKDVVQGIILTSEDVGRLNIGSVSTSLFYDTRDNPFNPESGSINGVVLKFASSAFFSDRDYFKGTLQSSWFFKLRKNVVFAASVKGGTAYTFEGSKNLPLVERFFLGGRTTVRGYSHDTLGPKGANNNSTGGNAFALLNAEFRFDVGKGFGLVTFVDGGNVWKLVGESDIALKYTAGVGLRYNTPVGPLRLDYGHKLNREDRRLSAGELHFSFGHAF